MRKISDSLAESYLQVIADFEDERRIKWGGTAHEIRELLRNLLDTLAPDSNVRSQSWYKQQPDTSGPTQKQRVRYIIDVNNGDSRKHKAAQNVDIIDDKVADLVRDTYGRASDAAHRSKNKAEAFKILRYFEAFAYDLLGI